MGWLDDRVSDLRGVLADLQDLDFWPPWDAAQTLVDLVARAVQIATEPPDPDPENVRDAASAWRMIGSDADAAVGDLERVPEAITAAVWDGETGNALRTSVGRLSRRSDTVGPAARGVEQALTTLADAMADARTRHQQADDQLRDNLELSWGDLWPWELVDWLKGVAEGVIHAVEEAIGAYSDASTAVRTAQRDIVAAMDEIDLPDHLPDSPGVSAVSVVNGWDDDRGPLAGGALERYDGAYDDLSPAQQQAVRDALAAAGSDAERAWIMAGVASGLGGAALTRYMDQLGTLTPAQLRDLDPTRSADGLTQPDQTTCGSSTLVMSRMHNDPAYAMWVLTGYNPETGETAPPGQTVEDRFKAESLEMHDRTNSPTDRDGDLQFPWPEAIGTQPWALANEMSADGGSGAPGTEYDVRVTDPDDRGRNYDEIAAASEDGHTVPLYIGDTTHPGHVVLVTASDNGTLTIYEPANGETVTVTRDDFVNGDLGVAGWDEPWFAVTPR